MILGVFAVAFALTASVAFANCGCNPGLPNCLCPSTTVVNLNGAKIDSNVSSLANTGDNAIGKGHFSAGVGINTGAAYSGLTSILQANYNEVDIIAPRLGKVMVLNGNMARITSTVGSTADTGGNAVGKGCFSGVGITTGAATSSVNASILVNTNVIKINKCCGIPVCPEPCDP